MARQPNLTFDRGTLILHPPPRGNAWINFAIWDDRIEKFRIPAIQYRPLVKVLNQEGIEFIDHAKIYSKLELIPSLEMPPYLHQTEALTAWQNGGGQGVVVLPTAAGKTYLAQLVMQTICQDSLIIVPTLDLMHQWYAHLKAAFPDVEVGLLGGGSRDKSPILVATYDSATIQAETLGNRYGLIIFDECHHLPTDYYRVIAEYSIAPYRLGLTATPDRNDGRHNDLDQLIGRVIYRKKPEDLAGLALAEHQVRKILVKLSPKEIDRYNQLIQIRNEFLKQSNIKLGGLDGWKQFVMASARSSQGRRAMLAHRESKDISLCTHSKMLVLADILAQHYGDTILIFTADNATVYQISQNYLIPAITHQTPIKERHEILAKFRQGEYKSLVASHVLNEGVDVPDAKIAVILSGTGSQREYIQRLGRVLRKGKEDHKQAILYEVISEDTSEERTSDRRRGKSVVTQLPTVTKIDKPTPVPQPSVTPITSYHVNNRASKKAAEKTSKWPKDDGDDLDDET